jgi:hypothetical protein
MRNPWINPPEMYPVQQRIRIEAGIDDLCEIIDIAEYELSNGTSFDVKLARRLLAVIKDINKQIDAGGVR